MRGFLLGAIVGAFTAIMIAPRRGEETREMVRTRVDLWQDQLMNRVEQARGEVQALRREMLGRLDEMRSQYASQAEQMKIQTEGKGEAERRQEPPVSGI